MLPLLLPMKFLNRLPTQACHSSAERREKMKADWWARRRGTEGAFTFFYFSLSDKQMGEKKIFSQEMLINTEDTVLFVRSGTCCDSTKNLQTTPREREGKG